MVKLVIKYGIPCFITNFVALNCYIVRNAAYKAAH